MDFIDEYELNKNFLSVTLGDYTLGMNLELDDLMWGSGGSDSIVLVGEYRWEATSALEIITKKKSSDKKYNLIEVAIKIFPRHIYHNSATDPNFDDLEIALYKFFTQRFLLKERTPHLIGIYIHNKCSNIKKLIKKEIITKMLPDGECIDINTSLQIDRNEMEDYETSDLAKVDYVCDIINRVDMKIFSNECDIIVLERADAPLTALLDEFLHLKTKNIDMSELISRLKRVLFQIIFTLSIIKDDYPGFYHGDLYMRNILISEIDSYAPTDFIEYKYQDQHFFLEANGVYSKVNDWGMSIISNHIESNIFDPVRDPRLKNNKYPYDPLDRKVDFFTLITDIIYYIDYATSEFDFQSEIKYQIFEFLNKFINIEILSSIDTTFIHDVKKIEQIPELNNCIRTPKEILQSNVFDSYKINSPNQSNIIRKFNF